MNNPLKHPPRSVTIRPVAGDTADPRRYIVLKNYPGGLPGPLTCVNRRKCIAHAQTGPPCPLNTLLASIPPRRRHWSTSRPATTTPIGDRLRSCCPWPATRRARSPMSAWSSNWPRSQCAFEHMFKEEMRLFPMMEQGGNTLIWAPDRGSASESTASICRPCRSCRANFARPMRRARRNRSCSSSSGASTTSPASWPNTSARGRGVVSPVLPLPLRARGRPHPQTARFRSHGIHIRRRIGPSLDETARPSCWPRSTNCSKPSKAGARGHGDRPRDPLGSWPRPGGRHSQGTKCTGAACHATIKSLGATPSSARAPSMAGDGDP